MFRASRPLFLAALALAACSESPSGGVETDASLPDATSPTDDAGVDAGSDAGPPLGPECSSSIPSSASAAQWVRLCELDGVPRHVRIEGVSAPATHASAQIFFGFDAQPAGSQASLGDDQLKVMLYGGGTPGPAPQLDVVYGSTSVSPSGDDGFINEASTVCFDLHDGSATTPPYFVLWLDGEQGADCHDASTLSLASAYAIEVDYGGAVGAVAKARGTYFYQAAGITTTPTITLSTEPVLTEAATAAAGSCETSWQPNVDWQPLCEPAAGRGRHFVLRDASAPNTNKYFYLVVGQDGTPTGSPSTADGDGRFIFTGGHSNSGASWTYFRFDGSSTTQFGYTAGEPAAALYTTQPNTVCLDLREDAGGHLQVRFWASGAGGADCEDVGTLTVANALYDSETSGDDFWDSALGLAGSAYLKISGSDPVGGASFGTVSVSTRLAVP